MPELPEVQNTVDGLNEKVVDRKVSGVWTDYDSSFYYGKEDIKDPNYFKYFARTLRGKQIIKAERRAKEIFITLSDGITVIVHMKMTGHFLYGKYHQEEVTGQWIPERGFWNKTWDMSKEEVRRVMPLSDPFNGFIRLVFILDNGMHLVFSDMRKFAKIYLLENALSVGQAQDKYGPEPLEQHMRQETLFARIKKYPYKKIKTALLDQRLVSGYGNIYTDEILFAAAIHPESEVGGLEEKHWQDLFTHTQNILLQALKCGGDSMGDYRRIDGSGGTFHNMHKVYQKEKTPCPRCGQTIEKKQIQARMGRFCPGCQKYYTYSNT